MSLWRLGSGGSAGVRGRRLAALTALAAGVALVLVGSAAAAQAYGVSPSMGCVSPVNVGDAYTCTAELDNNNSTSQDTVRMTSLDDEVDSSTGAHTTTIPINSSTPGLTLLNLGGGLPTCDATGCTLPYNTGLQVTFSHYTTVVGDFPSVSDTATYHWNDTCQFTAPGTACSTGPKSNQAGASADITPLPTNTTTSINSGGNSAVSAVEAGSSVTDSVTVSAPANQPPPTGHVTVNFYSTIDCSGNPADAASTDALDANGQALNVHPEGPLPVGLYSYQATYPGDGGFGASPGACESLRVVDANIQISPQNATNPVGANHTLIGQVNVNYGSGQVNAPDGTVISFSLSNANGATATFVGPSSCTTTLGSGSCTVVINSPTAGSTSISASTAVSVSGVSLTRTTNGTGGSSGPASKLWADAAVRTDIHDASHNVITTANAGDVVHDKAFVTKAAGTPIAVPNPTGNVVFHLYPTLNCGGSSTDQTVALAADGTAESASTTVSGDISYSADYQGDANYPARSGACEPLTVAPALAAPGLEKTAVATHHRKVRWAITKLVDGKSSESFSQASPATLHYSVALTKTVDYDTYGVTGDITASNTNSDQLPVTISETGLAPSVSGSSCTLDLPTNPTSVDVVLDAGSVATPSTYTVSYTCTFTTAPASTTQYVNGASVTYDSGNGIDEVDALSDLFTFPAATEDGAPESVNVSDPNAPAAAGFPQTATGSTTYTYTQAVFSDPCTQFNNTASIVETSQSSSTSVAFCGPKGLLTNLLNYVNGLPPGTSLPSKVQTAINYYNAGDIHDTCTALTAVINQTKAVSGKKISKTQANTVIAMAKQTQAVLGC